MPIVKAASEQATTTCDLAADSFIATSTGDSETVPSYIEENGEVIWTLEWHSIEDSVWYIYYTKGFVGSGCG